MSISYTTSYKEHLKAMADPAIVKEVCANIKQMRLSRNITQAELASRAGVDRTTVSRMESGRAATLLTLVQILRALDRLDLLNVFHEEPEISPLQILRVQERRRKYASGKHKAPKPNSPEDYV
jgi:transcriptional regulator with XRE-family HTH domain